MPPPPRILESPSPPWFPAGQTDLAAALEKLMWIIRVDYPGFGNGLIVSGCIIPPEGDLTEGQRIARFAESLEEIADILDQAGVELIQPPEFRLSNGGKGLEMAIWFEITDYD